QFLDCPTALGIEQSTVADGAHWGAVLALIGIDLGTTNSAVAAWTDAGPRLIANALGENLTPSVIRPDDASARPVGHPARNRLVAHPQRTVASFKRWMGTMRETRLGRGHVFRPEELSAFVLKSLKADAEAHLGGEVREAVISVPAYFNDVQRKATLDAAGLAGLQGGRLVHQATAAAPPPRPPTPEGRPVLLPGPRGGAVAVSLPRPHPS